MFSGSPGDRWQSTDAHPFLHYRSEAEGFQSLCLVCCSFLFYLETACQPLKTRDSCLLYEAFSSGQGPVTGLPWSIGLGELCSHHHLLPPILDSELLCDRLSPWPFSWIRVSVIPPATRSGCYGVRILPSSTPPPTTSLLPPPSSSRHSLSGPFLLGGDSHHK